MTVKIFGKESCPVCKQMKEKLGIFISHWKIDDKVKLQYCSVDDPDGLAEAAMQDATEVPAIILEDSGKVLAKWTGRAVESKEFKPFFDPFINK